MVLNYCAGNYSGCSAPACLIDVTKVQKIPETTKFFRNFFQIISKGHKGGMYLCVLWLY